MSGGNPVSQLSLLSNSITLRRRLVGICPDEGSFEGVFVVSPTQTVTLLER
jgi:hypothetical protein